MIPEIHLNFRTSKKTRFYKQNLEGSYCLWPKRVFLIFFIFFLFFILFYFIFIFFCIFLGINPFPKTHLNFENKELLSGKILLNLKWNSSLIPKLYRTFGVLDITSFGQFICKRLIKSWHKSRTLAQRPNFM